jgi:sorting and assembly machinery component 37
MATLNAGDTIVDLYLYVTYANYIATTRHAYTSYLPLISNYTIPPAHRKAAIARTESYGVDFLQSDLEEPPSVSTQSGGISTVPATSNASLFGFRKQQLTLASRRMRLNSILSRAISALEYAQEGLDRNGGKWTTSVDKPSFLDAIVIGYLGLILSVKVPDQWAVEIIREKVPRLATWAEGKAQNIFRDIDIQVL